MTRLTVVALAIVIVAMPIIPAMAQGALEYHICTNPAGLYEKPPKPDPIIFACSKVIADSTLPADIRGMAHWKRADAYTHKVQWGTSDKSSFDRVIADYSEALRLLPEQAYSLYDQLGAYYGFKGDLGRSIAAFTKMIELKPTDTTGYYRRGHAYQENGDKDSAIRDYRKALALDPTHGGAKQQLRGLNINP